MVMLDADAAGCVSTWLSNEGLLDERRKAVLKECPLSAEMTKYLAAPGLLGHRNPRVTLEVYSHLYDRQKTDDAIRAAMA